MELTYEQKKWILVVDDDENIRSSIVQFIRLNCDDDVRVVEAVDGIDATNKINHQKFHCIVTDIEMPKKEGESFISTARQNVFNELTPIIVVSGVAKQDIEGKFPFVYFIGKPFNSMELMELIKKQIQDGTTKAKVSAGVFNDLISLTSEFLSKILKSNKIDIGMAISKNIGERIDADFVSTINVTIGKVKNTFSILSKKEDIQKLIDELDRDGVDLRSTYKSMNYVILKHVMSKNGIADPNRFSAGCITSDSSCLTGKQGIIIPLTINNVSLSIFATVAS